MELSTYVGYFDGLYLMLVTIDNHLFDESHGSINGEGEKGTSSSSVNVPLDMGVNPS
jgi:hypothetical protein